MNKLFNILILFVFLFIVAFDNNNCDESVKKCNKMLEPYYYDLSEVTEIKYKGSEYMINDLEVTLYFGEKYRFVFNTENLSENVIIEVYNRKYNSEKKELVFTNRNNLNKRIYVFEPKKSKTLYINYIVPAGTVGDMGCVAFVLGYEIKKPFKN